MEEKTLFQNVHVRQSPQGHGREPEGTSPVFWGRGGKGMSDAGYRKSRHIIIQVDRYPSRPTGRKQKTNTGRRNEVMRLRTEGTSTSSKS